MPNNKTLYIKSFVRKHECTLNHKPHKKCTIKLVRFLCGFLMTELVTGHSLSMRGGRGTNGRLIIGHGSPTYWRIDYFK